MLSVIVAINCDWATACLREQHDDQETDSVCGGRARCCKPLLWATAQALPGFNRARSGGAGERDRSIRAAAPAEAHRCRAPQRWPAYTNPPCREWSCILRPGQIAR